MTKNLADTTYTMEGEWGEQPKIPETETLRFAKRLASRLEHELPTLLGMSDLNSGSLSRDRQTIRLNFYTTAGTELLARDWVLVQEYARTVFSELAVTPDDEPINDTIDIEFNDRDSEYDNKRTIIIRTK